MTTGNGDAAARTIASRTATMAALSPISSGTGLARTATGRRVNARRTLGAVAAAATPSSVTACGTATCIPALHRHQTAPMTSAAWRIGHAVSTGPSARAGGTDTPVSIARSAAASAARSEPTRASTRDCVALARHEGHARRLQPLADERADPRQREVLVFDVLAHLQQADHVLDHLPPPRRVAIGPGL